MIGLLDTHTFLWWDEQPAKLSARVRALCQDPKTRLVLSVVSLWEIVIKAQLGKLVLADPLSVMVAREQRMNNLKILPVRLKHVLGMQYLPPIHKDPFDRLLIAQAQVEGAVLLSADAVLSQYPVQVAW